MDAIIVLGGGINKDGSLPELPKKRLEKALKIRKDKPLLMSGRCGFMVPEGRITEAEGMKRYAINKGVPENKIFKEEKSKDTIGNAYFSKLICIKHDWTNLAIVTSDFHIKRTKYIFDKVFGSEYTLKYVSAISDEEISSHEKKILALTKKWMDNIKKGNHEAVKELMETMHPGYAKFPKITKEMLQKLIA